MSKIQPLGDKILVQVIEKEKTEGGLLIANSEASHEPKRGKVLAVGEGITYDNGELRPFNIKENEIVIFNPTSAINVDSDGVKCKVITIRDVYGKEIQ